MAAPLLQRLTDDVQQRLAPDRFLHVLGVTHTAADLAHRHGASPERAAVAALLHDRSKPMSPEEIEADLARRHCVIPEEDRPHPALWHAVHAAALVRQEYGLSEADGVGEIAEAVTLHSTADRAIGALAKILFIADFIEPGRDFEGVEELRAVARRDLEAGFRRCLAAKCRHMEREGRTLSVRARRALEYYNVES